MQPQVSLPTEKCGHQKWEEEGTKISTDVSILNNTEALFKAQNGFGFHAPLKIQRKEA